MRSQAALDTASHIVSDERLGEPRTNRGLFDLLERAGWIEPVLAGALRDWSCPGYAELRIAGATSDQRLLTIKRVVLPSPDADE